MGFGTLHASPRPRPGTLSSQGLADRTLNHGMLSEEQEGLDGARGEGEED